MYITIYLRKLIFYPFRFVCFSKFLPIVYRLRYFKEDLRSPIPEDELSSPVRRELSRLVLSYNPSVLVDYGCGSGANAFPLIEAGFSGTYVGIDVLPSSLQKLRKYFDLRHSLKPSLLVTNSDHSLSVYSSMILMDAVCIYNHPLRLEKFISDLIGRNNSIIIHEPFLSSDSMTSHSYNSVSATWSYSPQFFIDICVSRDVFCLVQKVSEASQKWSIHDCFLVLNPPS